MSYRLISFQHSDGVGLASYHERAIEGTNQEIRNIKGE